MSYYDLSSLDVTVAALLILINGAISFALGLGLEKRLLIAAVRTVVQLLLLGYVLKWIFGASHWLAIVGMMLAMSAIAGVSAVRRTERRYPGVWLTSMTAVMASSWIVLGVALTGVISPAVWSSNPAQYAIPLMGMILGNTLNGISLGLDRLTQELTAHRPEVEMRLCLGANRWEAARPFIANSIRTGMVPIINSMMVVGLVSLPGMMTGQILAGAEPMAAVRYQIVIMFLIAAGAALGTTIAVLLGYRRLFNRSHQFLSGTIRKVKT